MIKLQVLNVPESHGTDQKRISVKSVFGSIRSGYHKIGDCFEGFVNMFTW